MEDLKKQIGDRLREKREALGLSQGEVAKKMGATPLTVHRVENGLFEAKIGTVVSYCRAVGLPMDDLLLAEPIEKTHPTMSSGEIVFIIQNALKVAENPLIQRLLACSKEERDELSKRLDMIEHRRKLAAESAGPAKVAKNRE